MIVMGWKKRFPGLLASAGIGAVVIGCSSAGTHPTVADKNPRMPEASREVVAQDSTFTPTWDINSENDGSTRAGAQHAASEGEADRTDVRTVQFTDSPDQVANVQTVPYSRPDSGDGRGAGLPDEPRRQVASSQRAETPPPPPAPDGDAEASPPQTLFDNTPQLPINLATALQVTAGQNPEVGFAQQRIQEAYAQLQLAEVLWVPSIRAGVNYNKHDGTIQNVEGDIVENSRSSVYTGLGAQAVGAGSPAVPGVSMNFHLRDAIFQPRITEQVLGARQQASRATINDTLLETALRYTDLLEALQIVAVAQESLENAEQLSRLTKSFADTGQGLQADADRAMTELSVRQVELRRAVENARVASVRLGQVLSQQDQSRMLFPQEPALVPIDMVQSATPLSELIATGLSTRPELAESRHLVGAAIQQLRRECYAPLVPSVLLGLSYGGNGGSPTSTIRDFGDRVDFDAVAYWEIRNLGFGERSAREESRSRVEQARWRQVQIMDEVASEVAEAHARVEARQAQIELAEVGITTAEASYRRNTERIRDGQGLPIETLQSIQALDVARRQYVRAVADYNRAQFQLHRALGWPIQ